MAEGSSEPGVVAAVPDPRMIEIFFWTYLVCMIGALVYVTSLYRKLAKQNERIHKLLAPPVRKRRAP